jgi:aryl-alcohol dehydrogenase-like predicted oxidoreductase
MAGTRSEQSWAYPEPYFAANADATLQVLLDIAKELECSPAQVAIRWVLDQPQVTSAIIGARTTEHAHNNMLAGGWRLPEEALTRLNQVSQLAHRYPRSMEENMSERRSSALKMPSLD